VNVVILNMTSILAQVRRDAISSRSLAKQRGLDGVWFQTAASLSQCGHVVNVHEQSQCGQVAMASIFHISDVRVHDRIGKPGVLHAGNAAEEEAVRKRDVMTGFVILALSVSGCSGGRSGSEAGSAPTRAALPGAASGAASAKEAVEVFMRAVKAQDLQTMSAVWGTVRGPAREQMEREELEKRLIIIQCKLDHLSWSFLEDRPRLLAGGKQDFQVQLRDKQAQATTTFTTILGPSGRWFVEIVDMAPLSDFCR